MVDLLGIQAKIHISHYITREHIVDVVAESATLAEAIEQVTALMDGLNMERLNYPNQTKADVLANILSDLPSYNREFINHE